MKNNLIDTLTSLAIEEKKKYKKPIHHQDILVKNGKIIGIGTNSLNRMNILSNDNCYIVNVHSEISAIKDYINKNYKIRNNFNRSKSYIRYFFHNSMNDKSSILCKKGVQ